MRNLSIIIGVVVLIILGIFFLVRGLPNLRPLSLFQNNEPENVSQDSAARAVLGDCEINLDLARSDMEKQQGLSGRESLSENEGMLFLFDQPGKYPFWMRDMNFDIDILYVNDEEIVEIFENAKKPASPTSPDIPIYRPSNDANRVLEIAAGRSSECGAQAGDTVEFSGL